MGVGRPETAVIGGVCVASPHSVRRGCDSALAYALLMQGRRRCGDPRPCLLRHLHRRPASWREGWRGPEAILLTQVRRLGTNVLVNDLTRRRQPVANWPACRRLRSGVSLQWLVQKPRMARRNRDLRRCRAERCNLARKLARLAAGASPTRHRQEDAGHSATRSASAQCVASLAVVRLRRTNRESSQAALTRSLEAIEVGLDGR